MELFGHRQVAEGYARARPRFHSEVIDRIRETLGLAERLDRALDVGCGAGLSTVPLMGLARSAVGVDAAADMVAAAERVPGVHYLVSCGERLPFAPGTFGVVTVAGAINWIDRRSFLPEANRVLVQRGWLAVYDGAEMGAMVGNDDFAVWYRDEYLRRLPRPPRDESRIEAAEAANGGFELVRHQDYALDLSAYVAFMLTQSNVTRAVEERGESTAEIGAWMTERLEAIFAGREQRLLFGGYIWCLLKR